MTTATTTLHRCAECHQPRALVTDVCRDCYDRQWDAQIDARVHPADATATSGADR